MDVMTNSAMGTFQACPRKFYFNYVARIKKDTDSVPLRFGSMVHDALERRLTGQPLFDEINKLYDKAIMQTLNPYEKYTMNCERHAVIATVLGYCDHWQSDGETMAIIDVEKTFNYIEDGQEWQGMKDAVVKLAESIMMPERVALMEHKTTSKDVRDEGYWARLSIDSQINLYYQAMQEKYGFETVLYDVIKRTSIKPAKVPVLDDDGCKIVTLKSDGSRVYNKNGTPKKAVGDSKTQELQTVMEDPKDFGDRIYEAILAEPQDFFERRELPRLDINLDESAKDRSAVVRQIAECESSGHYPKATQACNMYHSLCPYFNICSTCGTQKLDVIPEGYVLKGSTHTELERNRK